MKFIIDVCQGQEYIYLTLMIKNSTDTKFDINGQINVREIKSG